MTIKAAEGSINVSNGLYQSSTLLWYAKKEKYLHNISTTTFTKIFFPCIPNLGAKLRCAQNWYISVQTDLKYPQVAVISIDAYSSLAFSDLTCDLDDKGTGAFWLHCAA